MSSTGMCPKSGYVLRLLTHVGFFSKTWSDTFINVLIYGGEQARISKTIFHNSAKQFHLPEKVLTVETRFFRYREI